MRWSVCLLCLCLGAGVLVWGCPPGNKGPTDASSQERPPETGADQGVAVGPLDQALAQDETRAGQLTKESERITGSQALNVVGDWKLYNNKVAFAIHGIRPSASWAAGGGHIIDASPVDAQGKASHDYIEEISSLFSYEKWRTIRATKIEVIEAGGKGKRAVVRVTAEDIGVPILDTILKSKRMEVSIEIDYILEPDSPYLTIVTRVGTGRFRTLRIGDAFLLGAKTRFFSPLAGWDLEKAVGKSVQWVGGLGHGAAYLLAAAADTTLSIPLKQEAVVPAFGLIEDDDVKAEYTRLLFVARDLQGVQAAFHAQRKTAGLATFAGQAQGLKDPAAAEAILLRKDDKQAVSQALIGTDGSFSFTAPAGAYTVQIQAPGHPQATAELSSSSSTKLTVQPAATLTVQLKATAPDKSEIGFVPARLEASGPQRLRIDIIQQGQSISLPPGAYTFTVSRGLEYEFDQQKATLAANANKTLTFNLARVVDTTGYVGGDMHLHAAPSADSDLPVRERVSAVAAEGLLFAATSDHDTPFDYGPIVKQLKLTPFLRTVVGEEISPLSYHFGAFPIQRPTNLNAYFAIPWAVYDNKEYQSTLKATEIWDKLRTLYKAQIIQINHPRKSNQGYFNAIGYDPTKGTAALDKKDFNDNWDSIELYNGSGRGIFLDQVLPDWFSLLNQGYAKTAVANSDSHGASARPGMPRTLIASSKQKPEELDIQELVNNLKAGRAQVYAGPFIKAQSTDGKGPGDRIKSAKLTLNVEVHAPSWIATSYLKLYANGKLAETIPVPESKDVIRLKHTFNLAPSQDTWYVLLAGDDDKDMKPVYPGRKPISMTNPIYLDIDSNGFKAPGLP